MDHWVDRPEVQARQRAQPTGTNRPTRTTHPHAHAPAPAPERAGAGGEPDHPRPLRSPEPTHPTPTRGGRPPGAAHHNPTTVPAATAGGETPGPIPNPEAKPPSANGTAPTRERKSRTPPEHTPPARAGPAPQPGAHPARAGPHPHPYNTTKVIQRAHGGALLCGPLALRWTTAVRPSFPGAEVHVSASGAQRRRAPRSARSPGNRRDRHLTRENVCQRYVLAGQVTISRVK